MWNKKPLHEANNQRWRYDPSTETFESFHKSMVLDAGSTSSGEHVLVWNRKAPHDNHNQRFYLAAAAPGYAAAPVAYLPTPVMAQPQMGYPGGQQGCFFIKSRLHNKVLDVKGGSTSPGAHVILWDQKRGGDNANQLWSLSPEGFIVSKATGLVLDIEGGAGAGHKLVVWNRKGPSEDASNQRWRFDPAEEKLLSYAGGNLVIDIEGGNTSSGAHAIAWNRKARHQNDTNQRWFLEPHY